MDLLSQLRVSAIKAFRQYGHRQGRLQYKQMNGVGAATRPSNLPSQWGNAL